MSTQVFGTVRKKLGLPCFFAMGLCAVIGMIPNVGHADVVLGQVDTFSGGTADGWQEGGASPNPPVYNAGLGPNGIAGHLENDADGSGSGGRMQMFIDDSRWQGNYLTAGVTNIWLFADNRSGNGTPFNLRIAMDGPGGWFVSDSYVLSDGSGWAFLNYELSAMTHVAAGGGSGVLNDTLSAVSRFEILSAAGIPSWASNNDLLRGDSLIGDLRVDNIAAIPEPASAGLMVLMTIGFVMRRPRRLTDSPNICQGW